MGPFDMSKPLHFVRNGEHLQTLFNEYAEQNQNTPLSLSEFVEYAARINIVVNPAGAISDDEELVGELSFHNLIEQSCWLCREDTSAEYRITGHRPDRPMVVQEPVRPIPPQSIVDKWYRAYRKLGGSHDQTTFFDNERKFEELTMDAYINGLGRKEPAWAEWVAFIGSEAEARRYYKAVDSVTPYA